VSLTLILLAFDNILVCRPSLFEGCLFPRVSVFAISCPLQSHVSGGVSDLDRCMVNAASLGHDRVDILRD